MSGVSTRDSTSYKYSEMAWPIMEKHLHKTTKNVVFCKCFFIVSIAFLNREIE